MNNHRIISRCAAAILMFAALMMMTGIFALAEDIPSKVHIRRGSIERVDFNLPQAGDSVKNIKVSSKNLIVKKIYDYAYKNDDDKESANIRLGLFAKANGKYTIKFDIVGADGKKKSSEQITVKADANEPIKRLKLNGKKYKLNAPFRNIPVYTKKAIKIKVSMNKGFKLQKITYSRYDKAKNTMLNKKVANGGKIRLSDKYTGSTVSGNMNSTYYEKNASDSLASDTEIYIHYKDTYTGKTNTWYIHVLRM